MTSISVLAGSTFVVSDEAGDITVRPDEPTGFFARDMRHLSGWRLTLDGRPLESLAAQSDGFDRAVFVLVPPTGTVHRSASVTIRRERRVGAASRSGSVWPHDTSLVAAGLARYGFPAEAARVSQAVLDAASHFGHGLPEVFVGYARGDTPGPVRYPTSCSPPAWAAATPLLLLRVLRGLEPGAPVDGLGRP